MKAFLAAGAASIAAPLIAARVGAARAGAVDVGAACSITWSGCMRSFFCM